MNFIKAKELIDNAITEEGNELNLSSSSGYERLTDVDLKKILPDIQRIESLTSLNLYNNKITDATGLSELKSLRILNLASNRGISDYSFLSELKSLASLSIANNGIKDCSFLSELKSLTRLNARSNDINDASFLGGLKSLTWLALTSNQISDISFLGEIKSLTSLDLNDNRISDLSFLKELKSLTWLSLSSNQISDASFLRELKSLTSLDVSGNVISDASFVVDLKSLKTLLIYDNPKLDLPKNLIGKGGLNRKKIDEIVAYYKQLQEGEDYIYEAKVLIVGEPKAGKTTLFRKLQNPRYSPREATPEEKESTIGVHIEILEFPYNDEKNFKAHLWDFGGQEKQYVLHQYFFTERSLYVLLADDRKEFGNFNYWFEIIATLGSGCPVLVVLNEINAKVKNFDLSVYRHEFAEKIQDIEEKSVNFAIADGRFNNLENEIKRKLKNLGHIGKPLPKTWVSIRRDLQDIKEPIISVDDYNTICEKNGVENPDYRKQILEYLHDLGIALNYKYDDNLRNKLILKPNWVIDALYAVLKDQNIIKNSGKFSSDEVFEMWKGYTSDEKTILLQLMQKGKFEVAYKLANRNAYIAPILLPEVAPEYDFNESDNLQIHFEYSFKPKGIISRLIVRFHESIVVGESGEQIVWKKGVLLNNRNSTARIIESEHARKITISVGGGTGVENRRLITLVSAEIKRIHHDWFEDRLKFEEKIPCTCDVCIEDADKTGPQFYELETIEGYYELDQPLICDKSVKAKRLKRVNARTLLDGVYDEKLKKEFDDSRGRTEIHNYITNIIGSENKVFQGLKDTQVVIHEKLVDEVSPGMTESQRQEMEKLADEIIARIEARELARLDGAERKELEKAKKGKWETKLKFAIPLIPKIPFLENFLPSASIETTRTITPDEYISTVRKGLYDDDLQVNLLQDESTS